MVQQLTNTGILGDLITKQAKQAREVRKAFGMKQAVKRLVLDPTLDQSPRSSSLNGITSPEGKT